MKIAVDGGELSWRIVAAARFLLQHARQQLAIKLDMPVNLLRASLRRNLFEVEQCLGI